MTILLPYLGYRISVHKILQSTPAQLLWEAVYAYEQFDDDGNFDEDIGDYVEESTTCV